MPKTGAVLIYLRWFDSALWKGEACHPDEIDKTPTENESAGLLVSEDDVAVTIALDRCLDNGDIRMVLCVPRVNIRSIERCRLPAEIKT